MATLYRGDVREVLRGLPDRSVQMVMTSPPYWGLRDYGLEPQVWGGDPSHGHEWGSFLTRSVTPISDKTGLHNDGRTTPITPKYRETLDAMTPSASQGQFCPCGAWRGSLGLEPTPDLYIQHMVEIFAEVRRVLRDDGVMFVNMGDSYCGSPKGNLNGQDKSGLTSTKTQEHSPAGINKLASGLKPKDLLMMPARIALALQADGWWLRSDIIWSKPGPMPESVVDRPTKSHEYLFLLTKSGTSQYWTHRDMDGVRGQPEPDYRWQHAVGQEVAQEPDNWKGAIIPCPQCGATGQVITASRQDLFGETWGDTVPCDRCEDEPQRLLDDKKVKPPEGHVWEWARANLWMGHDYYYDQEAIREPNSGGLPWGVQHNGKISDDQAQGPHGKGSTLGEQTWEEGVKHHTSGRNKRTVWTIATQPFPDAHFAVFPEALCEPPVLAGSSPKACAGCGAPWERVVAKDRSFESGSGRAGNLPIGKNGPDLQGGGETIDIRRGPVIHTTTTGWRPTCSCEDAGISECVVLDPFCGTGTVGLVAKKLGRRFIGIDLSEKYLEMARRRIEKIPTPMAMEV